MRYTQLQKQVMFDEAIRMYAKLEATGLFPTGAPTLAHNITWAVHSMLVDKEPTSIYDETALKELKGKVWGELNDSAEVTDLKRQIAQLQFYNEALQRENTEIGITLDKAGL